jgi:hypothetical protein
MRGQGRLAWIPAGRVVGPRPGRLTVPGRGALPVVAGRSCPCVERGMNTRRLQPAGPTTAISRTASGHAVSQAHRPATTGRNSSHTRP